MNRRRSAGLLAALALPAAACASPEATPPLHQETIALLEGEWLVEEPAASPAFLGPFRGFPQALTNPPPLSEEALTRAPTELRLVFLGGAPLDRVNDASGYLVARLEHPDLEGERTYVTTYGLHATPDHVVWLAPNGGITAGGEGYQLTADRDDLILTPAAEGEPVLRLRRHPAFTPVDVPARLRRAGAGAP